MSLKLTAQLCNHLLYDYSALNLDPSKEVVTGGATYSLQICYNYPKLSKIFNTIYFFLKYKNPQKCN